MLWDVSTKLWKFENGWDSWDWWHFSFAKKNDLFDKIYTNLFSRVGEKEKESQLNKLSVVSVFRMVSGRMKASQF